MSKIVIYKITSPTNKVYIGQTVNFSRRVVRYKRLQCHGQKKLYNSFIKHGFDSHKIEVIHALPVDIPASIINDYEEFYIGLYKSCNVELMNLTKGGDGVRGYMYTKEHREKLSRAKIGIAKSESTKKKMSAYARNRPQDHIYNITSKTKKPVYQYSLDGILIKEWPSLKSIPKEFGFVRGCLTGRQKKSGGYFWEYKHLASANVLETIKILKHKAAENEKVRRLKISIFNRS